MKKTLSILLAAILLLGLLAQNAPAADPPRRIVSLAPSVTETLFALGLGDRVVGVSRYCDYPTSATLLPKLGGLVDPNYEEIVALRPDLAIVLESQADTRRGLERLGVPTLAVPHESLEDVHRAIEAIAAACGAEKRADALLEDITKRREAVTQAVAGRERPELLLCIGRDTQKGKLSGIYIAGNDGFYNRIIELAGGVNAYREKGVAYPQLSAEGVLALDPEVIIDLVRFTKKETPDRARITAQWQTLPFVRAVKAGRVHVLSGTHALRPGPRYVEFLEDLAALLHPEAFAEPGALSD